MDQPVSRRTFLKSSALALGGAAAMPLLNAYAAPAPARAGRAPLQTATVDSGFVSGEHDETLLREWIPNVQQDLGITLTVNDLGADALHDKISQGLRAGQSPYGVSAVVGFWLADFVGGGNFEPLD